MHIATPFLSVANVPTYKATRQSIVRAHTPRALPPTSAARCQQLAFTAVSDAEPETAVATSCVVARRTMLAAPLLATLALLAEPSSAVADRKLNIVITGCVFFCFFLFSSLTPLDFNLVNLYPVLHIP